MSYVRTICWRYHRKITVTIIVFSALCFFVSVTLTKRNLSNENVQGSNIETFQGRKGVHERDEGGKDQHPPGKNPSRKIHRIAHNALPAEGIKGLAKGDQKGQFKQKEDEFSSSSKSSSADSPGQKQSDAKPSKKFPQAIIIGVKKGGTRALLKFISQHPDIAAAKQEMHFFDRYYDKGLEWYRNQMPLSQPGQITMEKTPAYFITEEAPERIHKLGKNIKLIVVVRDPISRALSDFVQSVATGRRGANDFERLAVPDPKTGVVDNNYYALMVGRYAEHLERWFKYFPRSQFLFINGDALIKSPVPEVIKVQEFLKIDTIIDDRYFIFNSTKGFYCMKETLEDEDAKCLGDTKGREHPQVSPSILHKLKKYFKPHNARFYSMIGENFHWGEEEEEKRR